MNNEHVCPTVTACLSISGVANMTMYASEPHILIQSYQEPNYLIVTFIPQKL